MPSRRPRWFASVFFANTPEPEWGVFRKTLRENGWVEGQNLVLEERWMMGDAQRAGEHAASLVGLNPDVLVASSSTQVEALRNLTKKIPIIFLLHADPVGVGHVASLARPGGNITGLSQLHDRRQRKACSRCSTTRSRGPGASACSGIRPRLTHPARAKNDRVNRTASSDCVGAHGRGEKRRRPARGICDAWRASASKRFSSSPSPLTFRERGRLAELCLAASASRDIRLSSRTSKRAAFSAMEWTSSGPDRARGGTTSTVY